MRVSSPGSRLDPEDVPEATAVVAEIHGVEKVGVGKLRLEEEVLQDSKAEIQTP